MQALQRNGFNLNPDTAWRVAHQACEAAFPASSDMSCSLKESSAPAPNSG
jgi:hypothetical protein